MSEALIHRPLLQDEIRILTLEPLEPDADPSHIIRCALEHIVLSTNKESEFNTGFKGDDYVWPELDDVKKADFETLFKNSKRRRKHSEIPSTTVVTSCKSMSEVRSSDNQDMPWRHSWGDYLALSYVWGPPEPAQSILLNNEKYSVGPNLFDALSRLRSSKRVRQGFKLWIDAICINQTDEVERSHQVTRIRDIYTSASQVVVWLGPTADRSPLAMEALRWAAARSRTRQPLGFYRVNRQIDARPLLIKWETYTSPLRKEVYEALFYLFTRPYWRRMWILQEMAIARENSPVICGDECLSWDDVHAAATLIASDEQRFGRDIIGSVRPRILQSWNFEFARDRMYFEHEWASERMWQLLMELMRLQREQKTIGIANDSTALLRALQLSQNANVSENRDKVYGILGLKSVADRVAMVPDYQLPLVEIYRAFSERLLLADVNVLRQVTMPAGWIYESWALEGVPTTLSTSNTTSFAKRLIVYSLKSLKKNKKLFIGTVCDHKLPSWAICWMCKAVPTAHFRGLYHAGGERSELSIPTLGPEPSLYVHGLLFDKVMSLSSFHAYEAEESYPFNSVCLNQENAYRDFEGVRTALWKTLVADTTAEGGASAPKDFAWLLNPRIWKPGVVGIYTNCFGFPEFMGRNKGLNLSGFTLSQLIFGRPTKRKISSRKALYNPTEIQRDALSWAMNALAWRRLIGTENGRMGLAPAATNMDDMLAVIIGCDTPLVLRSRGHAWTVIGECYIHGVMDGEILNGEEKIIQIKLV